MSHAKKWYMKIEGRAVGPVTTADLNLAAQDGRLTLESEISTNGIDWCNAGSVEGLEFGDGVSSTCGQESTLQLAKRLPPAANMISNGGPSGTQYPNRDVSAVAAPTQAPQEDPLIRVTYIADLFKRGVLGFFHAYQIVGVFDDCIIVARSVRYPRLANEDCTNDGLSGYLAKCALRQSIPFDSIVDAEFRGVVRKSLRGEMYPDSAVELRIRTAGRVTRLCFHRRDVTNLHKILRLHLQDRLEFAVRWRTTGLGLIGCFLLYMLFLVFWLIAAHFFGSLWWPSRLPVLSSFALVLLVKRLMQHDDFMPNECLSAPVWPPPNPIGPRVRQPFRSRLVGFGIKAIAFVWLAAVLFYVPIRNRLSETFNGDNRVLNDQGVGVAIAFLCVPSMVLLYIGHGVAQPSPKTAGTSDKRRTILFLRSFALDGKTTLQPSSALAACLGVSGTGSLKAWFTEVYRGVNLVINLKFFQCIHPLRLARLFFGAVADTTEQSLSRYFATLGPVRAIGKPGERIAEAGAIREYVADGEWQRVVLHHLRNCQAVIIQPSQTGGMKWELNEVFSHVPREKVLIVLCGPEGMSDDCEDLRTFIEQKLSKRFPKCLAFRGTSILVWFERDDTVRWTEVSYRSPASWLITGDAVDLEYSLRPFVRGIHGGERQTPGKPRKHAWYHYGAAWCIVALWLVGFGTVTNHRSHVGAVTPSLVAPRSTKVTGVAFPYAVDVPESWAPRIVSQDALEHEFAKPGVGIIKIVAHPGTEDLERLPEQLIASSKTNAGALGRALVQDVVVESTQPRVIGDRSCVEIRLRNNLRTGAKEFQRITAYSGADGTFLINVVAVESVSSGQLEEIHRILGSVRFSRSIAEVLASRRQEAARRFKEAKSSEMRVVTGGAVPYSISVPSTWTSKETKQESVEHELVKPGHGFIRIIANAEREDLSEFAANLLQGERESIGAKGSAESAPTDTTQIDGRKFVRVQITVKMNDGLIMRETAIAYSGDEGTLAIVGLVLGKQITPEQEQELEEILQTVRIGKPMEQ